MSNREAGAIRYLLDTNICSYAAKAQEGQGQVDTIYHRVRDKVRQHLNQCAIAATTEAELRRWIELPDAPDWQRERARWLLAHLHVCAWNKQAEAIAAQIQANLRCAGLPIPPPDVEIAAVALRDSLILVTNDRHLQRAQPVLGLPLENWTAEPKVEG